MVPIIIGMINILIKQTLIIFLFLYTSFSCWVDITKPNNNSDAEVAKYPKFSIALKIKKSFILT